MRCCGKPVPGSAPALNCHLQHGHEGPCVVSGGRSANGAFDPKRAASAERLGAELSDFDKCLFLLREWKNAAPEITLADMFMFQKHQKNMADNHALLALQGKVAEAKRAVLSRKLEMLMGRMGFEEVSNLLDGVGGEKEGL